jgi:hypothetical protein
MMKAGFQPLELAEPVLAVFLQPVMPPTKADASRGRISQKLSASYFD